MGTAIRALSGAYTLLEHNSVILDLGWAAAHIVTIVDTVLGFIPLIGRLLSLFVRPVFLAACSR